MTERTSTIDPGLFDSPSPTGSRTLSMAILLAVAVTVLCIYANASLGVRDPAGYRWFPPFVPGVNANANIHLGGEYWHIARALVSGKGFANPFGADTGPTAWMPPLYPALLAVLSKILGVRSAVAWAIVFIKNLVLVFTGLLVWRSAVRTTTGLSPAWIVVFYFAWLWIHFQWFFQMTHDLWIVLMVVDFVLLGAWRLLTGQPTMRGVIAWGLLGGATILVSPIAGLGWIAVTFVIATARRSPRALIVPLLLAAAIGSVWIARNVTVFDRLWFVKSNLYFDLYQANYISESGVLDEEIFESHPIQTTIQDPDSEYRRLGEAGFADLYRDRFFQEFSERPGLVLRKAANRVLAATILYRPYRPAVEGRHPVLETVVYALPFLFLVALIAVRGVRLHSRMNVVIVFYAVALAPYVVSAFYTRYLLPLTPALLLFTFWGADALRERVVSNRSSRTSPNS